MELLDIIVVVVSPLVNLMKDQATKLENIGIPALTLSLQCVTLLLILVDLR